MNILVAQSGGPTPVINASLYGVVVQALSEKKITKVLASVNGMEGLLHNRIIELTDKVALIKRAKEQPGAIIGSSRYALTEFDYERIVDQLIELSIEIFCYIGGNGSAVSLHQIHEVCKARKLDIKCIFIPKTIDNDVCGTDHTPGYLSAVHFLTKTIRYLEADMRSISSQPQIEIMEVMGGNVGWLMAASTCRKSARNDFPQLAYLPEQEVSISELLGDIERSLKGSSNILLMVSDHMKINELNSDITIHNPRKNYNGGISYRLAQEIQIQMNIKTRITIPNSLYRSSMEFVSKQDVLEAEATGREAIKAGLRGETGKMIGIERTENYPYMYQFVCVDLSEISGKERSLPANFWDGKQHKATQSFHDYLLPLINLEALPNVVTLENLL
ncbi:diphosphate--fructose-6-phosphate 1-phosphotransferase [Peribacillus loiseleuriae]|uniref:Phosphofructokinase domain-containing protein n=1 Tax=Peribacillus loiseleuriae TaxID=1679170 RepID=A0A0K9GWI2_9BACI|nr:diphosphate--fructose-6-phosphate 1-phosphotransferase [Peribacillus loiseleuriae]KMY51000.1 hypothetical protein AC625_16895 [Peribacillus loiseleuriae]